MSPKNISVGPRWPTIPLRRLAILKYGDSLSSELREEGPYSVFGSNGVVGSHKYRNTDAPSIIIGRKGSFGKLTWAAHGGFAIDTTYFIDQTCAPTVNLRWLYYALSTLGLDQHSQDTGVPGLSREAAYTALVDNAPLVSQGQIADLLDRKTAAIDALIEKKRRLVQLLAEKRAALINQAVTKGLDPTVPMKDSGIPWIGEIPAHWEVKKLKGLLSSQKGYAFRAEDFCYGGVPVVKVNDFEGQSIRPDTASYLPQRLAQQHSRVSLSGGDIVLSTVGSHPKIPTSMVGIPVRVPDVHDGSLLNQNTVRLRTFIQDPYMKDYVFSALCSSSFRAYTACIAHGTANQASINIEELLNGIIAVPPPREVRATVDSLRAVLKTVEDLSDSTLRSVNRLQEYRQALITAAVTGQLETPIDESVPEAAQT